MGGEGTTLKPAEKHCVIRAWQIGCCCWIGEGSVINNKCVVEDCGMVLENTVLAPGTVVPPYTVFGGNPGRCVGRLPPTFDMIMNEHTHAFYAAFKPEKSKDSIRGSFKPGAHRSTKKKPMHHSSALNRQSKHASATKPPK